MKQKIKRFILKVIILFALFITAAALLENYFGVYDWIWQQPIYIQSPLKIEKRVYKILSPLPAEAEAKMEEVEIKPEDIDKIIAEAVEEFGKGEVDKAHLKQLTHCVIYAESKYWIDKQKGDNGKAAGPLQFWQGTWERMRKEMIKEGKATEIGTRNDLKEAVRTFVWAYKQGYGNEWGPLKRGECK